MSAASIEELERQIEDTRRKLDQTLSALRLELSVRHQWEQAWNGAKLCTAKSLRAGARWASANPIPVLLIGGAIYVAIARLRER